MISHSSWHANLDNKGNYIISTISDRQGSLYLLHCILIKRISRYITRSIQPCNSAIKNKTFVT